MEFSSSSSFPSIQDRSSRLLISLCSFLSSSGLVSFFNSIYVSQLSYCLLTATLKKRYNIAPKKETPTLDPSLNEQLSILCIYRSQWTSSTRFLIEEFTGILPSIAQEKSSSGRGDLSLVIHSKLYTTVVEYCPLYT